MEIRFQCNFADYREALPATCGNILVVLVCVVRPLWVRRDCRRHPNFSVLQVVRLNDEGLYSASDIAEGMAKWTAFTKFHETQDLFMLHMGARLFRIIPNRAFVGSTSRRTAPTAAPQSAEQMRVTSAKVLMAFSLSGRKNSDV